MKAVVSCHGFCAEGTATGWIFPSAGLAGGMEPLLPQLPSQCCLAEGVP